MFYRVDRKKTYTCTVDSMPVVDVPGLLIELQDHVRVTIIELAVVLGWLPDGLKLLNSVDL